ncbi:general substrate transporter [Metschnikowia bicuspidata var. bicuspidata NRRL YB-4993]|uniref:General substrate transporter n=1 Tax=Metschnikowia bicuspidata var. bicuspidata NRRL YB-4993 TaxID=869754 RepID=A0A1A0H5T7_9ASCO|nr:general substrate transporter [Metschnikowia bicuspidata var. bicuspidata NRRL YB-4993]OBA19396.1 general substrate transporter [Metschnikowia bicuspidata var. bicuspidata NRRL YB-4993]
MVALQNENIDFIPKDSSNKDDDFADWDTIDHSESAHLQGASSSTGVHMDNFGNAYDHVDFDSRKYTRQRKFKGQKLVYFTSAFVSLFVSLFGYEQGVCSGILTFVTFLKYFHNPTATEIGLVISILEIGAMVSSLLVSLILENIGRKRTILLGTVVFIFGGTLQTFASSLWLFGVGRIFSGFGVGVLSTVVPLYQCEISPVEERGKLVCGEFTGNIAGYCLSVWVDYFCYFIQDLGDARTNPKLFAANLSWRLPLFIQVILAFILLVGGFFVVESPRWLLDVDDDERGFHVLCLLYHDDPDAGKAEKEFFLIKNSILNERVKTPKRERSWRHLFRNYRLRIFIACSALAFAQFNGINIISYYAPMVFAQAGFNNSKALLMTGINAFIYLLSTIPPWFLVDKWGRKPILISGGLSMGTCLLAIAFVMYLDVSSTPLLVAFLVIVYNASFGFSWGPIGFLLPPEVYPLAVRSKGVSLSTASNWLANYVVGQLTPILQERIGWIMYLFPATSCIMSVVTVITVYPETKGVELEDIDKLFEDHKGSYPATSYSQLAAQGTELDEFDYELGTIPR